ncbi:MAG TPA: aminoglycoside phosphotransferase family protein [Acidimicrobiales bacterium]|nr:aminoglycoside phosphotransferase family protein [Acidimicrobiales bacterium]
MSLTDLVDRARAAVHAGDVDPSARGLEPLTGGMSHAVFAPIDDPSLVVKVFKTCHRQEPEREWEGLVALAGSGLAPEPIHLDVGDSTVVVMTRMIGASLSAGELHAAHAAAIGTVHRRVHGIGSAPRRPVGHSWVRASCMSLLDESQSPLCGDEPFDAVDRAWRVARAWVHDIDVDRILVSDDLRFSRGDPNLSNYLWSDEGLALVDWESSGYNDPVLEFADMAEHASTRALSEGFWTDLADATGLTGADRGRVRNSRRLLTCFWLVLIVSRQREGLPTTVTAEEQAHRTLAVLAP